MWYVVILSGCITWQINVRNNAYSWLRMMPNILYTSSSIFLARKWHQNYTTVNVTQPDFTGDRWPTLSSVMLPCTLVYEVKVHAPNISTVRPSIWTCGFVLTYTAHDLKKLHIHITLLTFLHNIILIVIDGLQIWVYLKYGIIK